MNNRQNGRRGRGRGGNGGNGGVRPMGGGGQQDRGNRIDSRARGNASQLHEKYRTLARDSQMQGDRVLTEYYLQFADHYFRVLAETRGRFDEQRPQQRRDFNDDYDGDGEGDGDEMAAGDQGADREPRRDRDYRQQDERPPQDGRSQQDSRPQREGRTQQDNRPQQDGRANGHHPGNGQAEGREPRYAEAREPRFERQDRDQPANGYQPAPPAPAEAEGRGEEAGEQPRRGRGRPRRERPPEAIEASGDRLDPPSFLSESVPQSPPAAPAAEASGEDAPAPRRRLRRPRAEQGELPVEV